MSHPIPGHDYSDKTLPDEGGVTTRQMLHSLRSKRIKHKGHSEKKSEHLKKAIGKYIGAQTKAINNEYGHKKARLIAINKKKYE